MSDRQPAATRSLGKIWGALLRARRNTLGLTQAQVAQLAGLSQQAVVQFEGGRHIPLDRTKIDLARALGTTPAELFPWPPMTDLIGDAA